MNWAVLHASAMRSDRDYLIAKVTTPSGRLFEAWAPPGSGAKHMHCIEANTARALRDHFGITTDVQCEAVANARLRLGGYPTGQAARAACEEHASA